MQRVNFQLCFKSFWNLIFSITSKPCSNHGKSCVLIFCFIFDMCRREFVFSNGNTEKSCVGNSEAICDSLTGWRGMWSVCEIWSFLQTVSCKRCHFGRWHRNYLILRNGKILAGIGFLCKWLSKVWQLLKLHWLY